MIGEEFRRVLLFCVFLITLFMSVVLEGKTFNSEGKSESEAKATTAVEVEATPTEAKGLFDLFNKPKYKTEKVTKSAKSNNEATADADVAEAGLFGFLSQKLDRAKDSEAKSNRSESAKVDADPSEQGLIGLFARKKSSKLKEASSKETVADETQEASAEPAGLLALFSRPTKTVAESAGPTVHEATQDVESGGLFSLFSMSKADKVEAAVEIAPTETAVADEVAVINAIESSPRGKTGLLSLFSKRSKKTAPPVEPTPVVATTERKVVQRKVRNVPRSQPAISGDYHIIHVKVILGLLPRSALKALAEPSVGERAAKKVAVSTPVAVITTPTADVGERDVNGGLFSMLFGKRVASPEKKITPVSNTSSVTTTDKVDSGLVALMFGR